MIKLSSVESPEDVMKVEGLSRPIEQHHSRHMVVSIEVYEGILNDPLQRSYAKLDSIQTKESDSTLDWHSDHEELCVEGDLDPAYVLAHEFLTIIPIINLSCIFLVVHVQEEFFAVDYH